MSTDRPDRRLAVIMATDAVGFSRLMHEDEDDTLAALRTAHRLLESESKIQQGRLFSRAGDSALVEFIDSVAAVTAGIAFQRGIEAANRRRPRNRRMRFRVGINLGTAVVEGDNLLGDCVNVAARLEGLSEPGGMCISGSVYEQVKDKVAAKYDSLGGRRLKNIDEAVRAYRVRIGRKRSSIHAWGEETAQAVLRQTGLLELGDAGPRVEEPGRVNEDSRTDGQQPSGTGAKSQRPDASGGGLALPQNPSVAVLRFSSRDEMPALRYCADLVGEQLVEALERIHGLFVVAARSSFALGTPRRDYAVIGRRLGVRFLVSGALSVATDRLRTTITLVDSSGGTEPWQQVFDTDLAGLQGKVAGIWRALAGHLGFSEAELPPTVRRLEIDLDAYAYIRQADEALASADGHEKALRLSRCAVERDPSCARAHACLAMVFLREVRLGARADDRPMRKAALDAAVTARDLDPSLPLAHVAEANAALWMKDHKAASKAGDRALTLAPNRADVLETMGSISIWSGHPGDAVGILKQSMRADPLNPTSYLFDLGHAYFCLGHYEDAISAFLRGSIRDPSFTLNQLYLAAAHGHLGESVEAARAIRRCPAESRGPALDRVLRALPYARLEDTDRLRDGLHKAGLIA